MSNTVKKYLIIHADDAGLAESENRATQEGMLKGCISSTSIMVPCPWFFEMAQFFLRNPHLDYGIHLTLTGEWKTYPFKPIAPLSKIPSLIDKQGYFFPKRDLIRVHANTNEVYIELKAQIETALSMGLKPSHLDSHMYTLGLREDLIEIYQRLGKEFNLPILLSKKLIAHSGTLLKNDELPKGAYLESIYMASFQDFEEKGLSAFYDTLLEELPSGLSLLLIHPAYSSKEMEQITLDHPNFGAEWRNEDALYFNSAHCSDLLKRNSIELIDWKHPLVTNLLGA